MSDWSEIDTRFMREALAKATEARSAEEVPVGAVVVVGGAIAGTGHNHSISNCDPTAHAEIIAIREAAKTIGNYRIADATVYVTLEPCPMCVGAMLHARVRRLVFGAYDPKAGAAGSVIDLCSERRLNHRIEVNGGLLADECADLLQKFFASRRLKNRTP
ncbi:MAG TPA: tRNA adenosine(34) deaminase TadA [Woeseiaceae bacterium]|nr:tRNA adenosine(34) deaminase TadA [Woeseiaceae bacterium]